MNLEESRWLIPRIIAAVVALVMTLYLCSVIQAQFRFGVQGGGVLYGIMASYVAGVAFWFAIFAPRQWARRHLLYAVVAGGALGAVGFVAGFFGPLIFTPTNNLGPLLGIFGTGPIGFVVGSILGFILASATTPRSKPPPLPPHS